MLLMLKANLERRYSSRGNARTNRRKNITTKRTKSTKEENNFLKI